MSGNRGMRAESSHLMNCEEVAGELREPAVGGALDVGTADGRDRPGFGVAGLGEQLVDTLGASTLLTSEGDTAKRWAAAVAGAARARAAMQARNAGGGFPRNWRPQSRDVLDMQLLMTTSQTTNTLTKAQPAALSSGPCRAGPRVASTTCGTALGGQHGGAGGGGAGNVQGMQLGRPPSTTTNTLTVYSLHLLQRPRSVSK